MNAFIKKTLLFIFFSSLFYSTTLLFWGSYMPPELKPNLNYRIGSPGHMFSRLQEITKTNNIDLLFIGSSHAYRGFDTRVFSENGFKVFNLGSSSQTPIQSLSLLKRYLGDLNPELIIFEVYPETLSSDGVESAVDIIANGSNDIHTMKMALRLNHAKVYNTLIYAKMREIFNLNSSFEEPYQKGVDTYITGGFVEREVSHYKATFLPEKFIEINNNQLSAFEEIVTLSKEKEIPVILVYAPIAPSNYNRYLNNEFFDSLMKSYSTYYNFNEIIHLDDSIHFYDFHHLNQLGVEVFNRKLIEILENEIIEE